MKILYFINQYPKVSHTFVRREIQALETLGSSVIRVSARHSPEELVDEADIAELSKTFSLIDGRSVELIKDFIYVAFNRPKQFFSGLKEALKLTVVANYRLVRHMAYLAEAASLLRLSEDQNVEHIHAHFGTNSTAVVMLCHIMGGPKYSFTLHGPEEFDHPIALSLEAKINRAAFVAAITSYCRSQLYRWCKWEQWKKIKEVHCGVDASIADKPIAPIKSAHKFLSIGRLCEQKGQMLLLEAVAKLKQQSVFVELDLIGGGELKQELEQYIDEHCLTDRVKLLGWKSGGDIVNALDESSVFILPSFAEGLPVVIMEAFARARPVLTTYIAGIPELVKDGQSGWLVPAGDADVLADKMKEITLMNVDVLQEMGVVGQHAVMERHDCIKEAKKLLHFMSEETDC